MQRVFVVALLLGVAGCGGGGSSTPAATHFEYFLNPTSSPTLQSALAVGDHARVTIQERRCGYWIDKNNQARLASCDPWSPPHGLAARVEPLLSGGPCGLTVVVTQPSTLDVTKTAAGDQNFAGRPGYCVVDLTDPQTGAAGLTAF